MASTFSTNLALELIGTGDQAGSWGNTTNTNLGTLIEQAISGYVTQGVTTGNTTSITIPDGATGVARNMFIELTGTGGTNTVLAVPSNKKLYFIYNNASGAVTVKVGAGTGVSVAATEKKILVSNGTDIVEATSYLTAVGGSLTLTTLTATSATITNLTSTSLTLSNNPTLSAGTANGVLYLNGSKVATSGSALTFDGSTLTNTGSSTGSIFNTIVNTNAAGSSGTDQRIIFAMGGSLGSGITGWANAGIVEAASTGGLYLGAYNGPINFATGSSARNINMTLTAAGNVGIGTASPTRQLSISNASQSNIQLTTTGAGGTITDGFQLQFDGSSNYVWGYENVPTLFGTNNTTRLTIDASGNLGLGVTPSAWSTGKAAEIGGVGSSVWGLSSGTTYFTAGYYFNTADKFAITGNYALFSQLVPADGSFRWVSSTATGTAGNNATMTERMRLDASGNLGIGTTTPNIGGYGANSRILTIQGVSGSYAVAELSSNSANSDGTFVGRLDFSSSGQAANYVNIASIASVLSGSTSTKLGSTLQFYTRADNAGSGLPTERARITATGNLLVGTTTDVASRSGTISDISGNVRAIPRVGSAKTAVYTLSISDVGQYVELGTGGGVDVPNGIFSTGDVVSVFNNTTGNRTISLTITTAYIAGTDADKNSVTLATRGVATVLFISNSVCVVNGNVS